MEKRTIQHITEVAKVPSFSTFEERLHPYIRTIFDDIPGSIEINAPGNNLIFKIGDSPDCPLVALAAHLDKINHYGPNPPSQLPVELHEGFIEGAMDDSAGLGILLALAEYSLNQDWPTLLFFFSEMEESKGLKEHPELLRNNGKGYSSGMGAKRISKCCLKGNIIPEEIITLDTTPLFEGDPGIALYSKHWELNDLDPSSALVEKTEQIVAQFISKDPKIKIDNNTNDYLHYGEFFNKNVSEPVGSVALEPAIYPYHQKGERVFIKDIQRTLDILTAYFDDYPL